MYKTISPVITCIGISFCCLLLLSCATEVPKPPKLSKNPIQLRVHNVSNNIIDSIEAKPCGYSSKQYKTQMTGIKPQQKIMLEIYQQCVDLVALDGFGTVLDELTHLRLNSNTIWTIR